MKIKYNEKFYKTIIYTILIMNILSFLNITKSQSKFKEENANAYTYSLSLYNPKILEEEEAKDPIDVILNENNINLIIDKIEYSPDSKNAFFEYIIQSDSYEFNYENIKNTINFATSLENVSCNIIKHNESKTDKGIVLCSSIDDNINFNNTGIILNITATDYKYEIKEDKKIKTKLNISAQKVITANEYKTITNTIISDKTTMVLNESLSYDKFIENITIYANNYYAQEAYKSYINDTLKEAEESDFYIDENDIINYINKYVDENNFTLKDVNIPSINYEEVIIGDKSRYIYKIEDNFIGYLKTYIQPTNTKILYFTTKDGRSFLDENDGKWQEIFNEYLDYFYQDEEEKGAIKKYITSYEYPNGVLDLLKQKGNPFTATSRFVTNFKKGAIEIKDTIFDYIYNMEHITDENIRLEIPSNSSPIALIYIYQAYKENLALVYKDKISQETLDSLSSKDETNPNLDIRNIIEDKIKNPNLNSSEEVIGIIKGLGSDDGKEFEISMYSDDKYIWFKINLLQETISNENVDDEPSEVIDINNNSNQNKENNVANLNGIETEEDAKITASLKDMDNKDKKAEKQQQEESLDTSLKKQESDIKINLENELQTMNNMDVIKTPNKEDY